MFSAQQIALYEELYKTAHDNVCARFEKGAGLIPPGMLGRMAGSTALGGAAVGLPLYLIKDHLDQQARVRTRDRAFGAGMATGIHGPQMLKNVFDIAQNSPDVFLGGGAAQ
jgi:hypothetical protein